jgi:hypothetical protein
MLVGLKKLLVLVTVKAGGERPGLPFKRHRFSIFDVANGWFRARSENPDVVATMPVCVQVERL